MAGGAGAVVSMVTTKLGEVALTFPAVSVAVAVKDMRVDRHVDRLAAARRRVLGARSRAEREEEEQGGERSEHLGGHAIGAAAADQAALTPPAA